jgi:predicted PurR-regulated permease PerM
VPLGLAVTVTLLTVVSVIIGLAASLALSVGRLATALPAYQADFAQLTDDLRAWLGALGVGPHELQAALGTIDLANVAGMLLDMLAGLAGTFSNMVLVLVVAAFMTLDAVAFANRLPRVRRERPEVAGALDNFVRGTRSYLVVSTVFGLIVAVIDTGFLWLVGVPLPLLWGLLAFITNYIPNIGFVIGLVPPALLALLEGGPQLMVTVIVAYSLINFVIQSIIQPKYVADAVDLSLTLTFVSLIFWSFVIGPLGALLAIPLTLLTKALLLGVDPSTQWIASLLAGGSSARTDTDEAAVAPHPGPEASHPGTGRSTTGEAPAGG